VKGLTQLHVGGRIPVVTVQNLGAKAMMEHFFFLPFFYSFWCGLLYQRKKGEQGGSNNSFHAIVYLKKDRQRVFGYD